MSKEKIEILHIPRFENKEDISIQVGVLLSFLSKDKGT